MHPNYATIVSFVLGIILPWAKRQIRQSVQWVIFSRICTLENRITTDMLKLLKLRYEHTKLSFSLWISRPKKGDKKPNDPSNN